MTSELEGIVQQLQGWSQRRDLIEEAMKSCHISLQNSEKDDKEIGLVSHWQISEIQLYFDKQSLVFKNDRLSYPYIVTQLGLYVIADGKAWFRDLEPIGRYQLITTLDGEIADDCLIIGNAYEPI